MGRLIRLDILAQYEGGGGSSKSEPGKKAQTKEYQSWLRLVGSRKRADPR